MLKGVSNLAQLVRATVPVSTAGVGLMVDIDRIEPDSEQPRRPQSFTEASLQEMAATIAAQGVIQPLIVAPSQTTPGNYLLIAGERRWRASRLAGLTQVPVVVRQVDSTVRLALQLIENLDRQDLSVIEEATAVTRLIALHQSQKDVAKFLGKTKSWVSLRFKLGSNMDRVEPFLIDDRTRDVDLLCLLIDLSKAAPATFADFLKGDRRDNVTRVAVRAALALAHGQQAPVDVQDNDSEDTGKAAPGIATNHVQAMPDLSPKDDDAPHRDTDDPVQAHPNITPLSERTPRTSSATRKRTSASSDASRDRIASTKQLLKDVLALDADVVPPKAGVLGHLQIYFTDFADLDTLIGALSSMGHIAD